MEENRMDERNGRIKAEKMLRSLHEQLPKPKNETNITNSSQDSSNSSKNLGDIHPIGTIRSIFKERNGTPRQGLLVPHSRGSIHLHSSVNPYSSLDGLQHFSHLWIVFYFHENTNIGRKMKQQLHHDKSISVVKSKIRPPRLDGKKVGIFSTRSPHRFTPIGLTLSKIESIDGNIIHLSGIDLLDGTPIVDIKPYVPHYDSVSNASVAPWVSDPNIRISSILWETGTKEKISKLIEAHQLEFYDQLEDVIQVIEEIIQLDIRSSYRRQLQEDDSTSSSGSHQFRVDYLIVHFVVLTRSTSKNGKTEEESIGKIVQVEETKREKEQDKASEQQVDCRKY